MEYFLKIVEQTSLKFGTKCLFTPETGVKAQGNNNLVLKKFKISQFWQKYSYLESWFAIRVKDFVKIVKRAGSIKGYWKEKKLKNS